MLPVPFVRNAPKSFIFRRSLSEEQWASSSSVSARSADDSSDSEADNSSGDFDVSTGDCGSGSSSGSYESGSSESVSDLSAAGAEEEGGDIFARKERPPPLGASLVRAQSHLAEEEKSVQNDADKAFRRPPPPPPAAAAHTPGGAGVLQHGSSGTLGDYETIFLSNSVSTRSSLSNKSTTSRLSKATKTLSGMGRIAVSGSKLAASGGVSLAGHAVKKRWARFNAFREHQRLARRNLTVEWMEQKLAVEKERAREELQREHTQRERTFAKKLKAERRRLKMKQFRAERQKEQDSQEKRDLDALARARSIEEHWMKSSEMWHEMDHSRREQERADTTAERVRNEAAERLTAIESAREHRRSVAEKNHQDGVRETTQIISSLRRFGFAPAILPQKSVDSGLPLETSERVLISVNKSAPAGESAFLGKEGRTVVEADIKDDRRRPAGSSNKSKRKRQSSGHFNVDLSRFPYVVYLQCKSSLGPLGGSALAFDLSEGSCSRLETLNLTYGGIGDRGALALVRAFDRKGVAQSLETLILRGNGVTALTITGLGEFMGKRDWLPRLRNLDLSENVLRDEGGLELSRQFLRGRVWDKIVTLSLRRNHMGDAGVLALYRALHAASRPSEIRSLCLRDNSVSPSGRNVMARSTSLTPILTY